MVERLERIVVVGASLAGLRTVEALRRRGYRGTLVLVGDEAHAPYDRPPLSKQVLTREWPAERVFFRRKEGFGALALDLRLCVPASELDTAGRRVTLADGAVLDYDAVVVATGAHPRMLPGVAPREGLHVLRTLDDALALADAFDRRPRVVLVGAGFIGLEVAAACRARGLDVSVVEPLDPPLARAIGPELGALVAELHRVRGVDLRTGVSVRAIEGEDRVRGVVLSDGGRIDADVVVVGIGVVPAVEWLAGSGARVDDGVVCDSTGATGVPGVFAAGDAARWVDAGTGEGRRHEHWTAAVEQAEVVSTRILEGPLAAPHAAVPYFWSDQYDRKIQFVGRCPPEHALRWVEDDRPGGRVVALVESAGRLAGAFCIGRPRELVRYRGLVARAVTIEEALGASG